MPRELSSQTRAFTLIELLTTMGIIAILAAMIVGVSSVVSRNMMEARTKARLEAMMTALEDYRRDRGYYPQLGLGSSDWADLSFATLSDFKHMQTSRPYLEDYAGGPYEDAWGEPYQYTIEADVALGSGSTETGYWLRSKGRDKKPDTDDDICSWKQR